MTIRIKDNMSKSLKKIEQSLADVPEAAYDFWRNITPIRTGNARRKTRLNQNTIEARYPYAQALDSGASRQAPQGMSEPTTQYLDREYKKRIRK
jgi:hypothetical protein